MIYLINFGFLHFFNVSILHFDNGNDYSLLLVLLDKQFIVTLLLTYLKQKLNSSSALQ